MAAEVDQEPQTECPRIRIFCVDDHPLIRKGISVIVNSEPDMELIAEAASGPQAIDLFRRQRPDVTLMDLRLPGMTGIDATIAIRAEFPETRVIVLTTFEGDVEIQRALRAGARGYILKTMPPEEMIQTIRRVYAGKRCVQPQIASLLAEHCCDDVLTARETEVLQKIADGDRNRNIAESLFISEQTVKTHIAHILEKLGASNRTEATVIGKRRGIIQL